MSKNVRQQMSLTPADGSAANTVAGKRLQVKELPWSTFLLEKLMVAKIAKKRLDSEEYYRVLKTPSLVPVLTHITPIHNYQTYLLQTYCNITLPASSATSSYLMTGLNTSFHK
jgi:hypothetical protein